MKPTVTPERVVLPVAKVVASEHMLEGEGFDERHSSRSPLWGTLCASYSAPDRIFPFADHALRAPGFVQENQYDG